MSRARRRWTDDDRQAAQQAGRHVAAEVRARRPQPTATPQQGPRTPREALIAAGLLEPEDA